MTRPYFDSLLDQQKAFAQEQPGSPSKPGRIWAEPTYGASDRAPQLGSEVKAMLDGTIPLPPPPPRPPAPDDQQSLF